MYEQLSHTVGNLHKSLDKTIIKSRERESDEKYIFTKKRSCKIMKLIMLTGKPPFKIRAVTLKIVYRYFFTKKKKIITKIEEDDEHFIVLQIIVRKRKKKEEKKMNNIS